MGTRKWSSLKTILLIAANVRQILLFKGFLFILFLNSKHGGYRGRSPSWNWFLSCNHCLRDLSREEKKPKGCSSSSSL